MRGTSMNEVRIYKPGKRQYRILKETINNFYEVERREKVNWLLWSDWSPVYHGKELDLEAATKLVEHHVQQDQNLRDNKKVIVNLWRD